jgi:hypothetical protein
MIRSRGQASVAACEAAFKVFGEFVHENRFD